MSSIQRFPSNTERLNSTAWIERIWARPTKAAGLNGPSWWLLLIRGRHDTAVGQWLYGAVHASLAQQTMLHWQLHQLRHDGPGNPPKHIPPRTFPPMNITHAHVRWILFFIFFCYKAASNNRPPMVLFWQPALVFVFIIHCTLSVSVSHKMRLT